MEIYLISYFITPRRETLKTFIIIGESFSYLISTANGSVTVVRKCLNLIESECGLQYDFDYANASKLIYKLAYASIGELDYFSKKLFDKFHRSMVKIFDYVI